jgi:hypothetical protein
MSAVIIADIEIVNVIELRHQTQGCAQGSSRVAMGLVKTYGVALAEVDKRVGVSTPAISKIIQRANQ